MCAYERERASEIRIESERETHTQSISLFKKCNNYKMTITQPLLKVTKSLYIVTNLGQLPFMLFTQMARTWAVQGDNVNTSIIHLYSTTSTGCKLLLKDVQHVLEVQLNLISTGRLDDVGYTISIGADS